MTGWQNLLVYIFILFCVNLWLYTSIQTQLTGTIIEVLARHASLQMKPVRFVSQITFTLVATVEEIFDTARFECSAVLHFSIGMRICENISVAHATDDHRRTCVGGSECLQEKNENYPACKQSIILEANCVCHSCGALVFAWICRSLATVLSRLVFWQFRTRDHVTKMGELKRRGAVILIPHTAQAKTVAVLRRRRAREPGRVWARRINQQCSDQSTLRRAMDNEWVKYDANVFNVSIIPLFFFKHREGRLRERPNHQYWDFRIA